jgi:hypothetical protein
MLEVVTEPHPRLDRPASLEPSRNAQRDAASLQRLEQLTLWLDRRYFDPILGALLPGAGDLVGAGLGLYGVVVALRLRAHPLVIARMLLNLGLDALLGALPGVGDVADFFYRANQRNLELLKQRQLREVRVSDWLLVGAAGLGFLAALSVPVLLVGAVLRALVNA